MKFYGSSVCMDGHLCSRCRSDREWRRQLVPLFDDIHSADFPCPYNAKPPKLNIPVVPERLQRMTADELIAEAAHYPVDKDVTLWIESLKSDSHECSGCARASLEARLRLWILKQEQNGGTENI